MQNYPIPTGHEYFQPPAPVVTAAGGPEAFVGPAIQQPPAPFHYPGNQLKLGGIADVKPLQVMGAIGGGVIGALVSSVLISVLPTKKTKDLGMITSIGMVPAMAIAGWFLFKEGYTYTFSEEEV